MNKNASPPASPLRSFLIVAIGASAGGVEAVSQLFESLSPTTGMAYIYMSAWASTYPR